MAGAELLLRFKWWLQFIIVLIHFGMTGRMRKKCMHVHCIYCLNVLTEALEMHKSTHHHYLIFSMHYWLLTWSRTIYTCAHKQQPYAQSLLTVIGRDGYMKLNRFWQYVWKTNFICILNTLLQKGGEGLRAFNNLSLQKSEKEMNCNNFWMLGNIKVSLVKLVFASSLHTWR